MRGDGKRVKIFIIVRVISHREIRGGDNEDGAERLREVIRLAVTIIDPQASHTDRDMSKSNGCKNEKKKRARGFERK